MNGSLRNVVFKPRQLTRNTVGPGGQVGRSVAEPGDTRHYYTTPGSDRCLLTWDPGPAAASSRTWPAAPPRPRARPPAPAAAAAAPPPGPGAAAARGASAEHRKMRGSAH